MDIRTFFIIFALSSLFTLLFLLFYSFSSHKRNKLLEIYALGKLFLTLSWIFLGLRGMIPNVLSIVFGNVFIIAGIAVEMLVISSYKHPDFKFRSKVFSIAAAVFSIIFLAFIGQPENVRIFITSLLTTLIILIGVVFLLKQTTKTKLHWLVTYIYLFLSIALILRGIVVVLIEKETTLLTYNAIQTVAFVSFLLVTYMGAISLLLLLKENDEEELKVKARELDDANSKLTATIASKNRFFSIIGHDLRGSIGNIAQMSDLLTNSADLLSERDNQVLKENLFKSATNTYDLLDNLLNWAKSQSGSLQVNRIAVALDSYIFKVLDHLQALANEKQISIINSTDPAIKVFVDTEMLQVIIRNLLSNAIKFTPVSGTVTISSTTNSDDVRITVSDTGVGIPFEIQQQLFSENFNQTTSGTKSEKGSGLGLKLVKDFVELNQGTIEFESTPNKGSTFSFTLPKAS
jgi:two-component system sensor histidine kinase/response regulator